MSLVVLSTRSRTGGAGVAIGDQKSLVLPEALAGRDNVIYSVMILTLAGDTLIARDQPVCGWLLNAMFSAVLSPGKIDESWKARTNET